MLLPERDELWDWLKSRSWLVLLIIAALVWGIHSWMTRPLHPAPGILVSEEPIQGPPPVTEPWTFRDHTILSLASFDLHGRILAKERYYFDRASELSPVDFAMGWGRMSDSSVLDQLKIWQDDRWYYWSASRLPIPEAEINSHSANMHMIPANAHIKNQLLDLRAGQVIHIQGQLIQAEGQDRWKWRSSLSRTDTGDGACEVIWVETVETQ
jgi:hypothetical protein